MQISFLMALAVALEEESEEEELAVGLTGNSNW